MSRLMKVAPLVVLCALIIAVPSVWAYWIQDGTALCTATGEQIYPVITSDGAGGAIVAWVDNRSGNYDIYAQRVNAAGAALWTADGVAICAASGLQSYPAIASDGAGGAIITWMDYRSVNCDIYAQRVNAAGTVLWIANGVALCTLTSEQVTPVIASDGLGGAIIAWADERNGLEADIYAQRVNASGAVQWTANGIALSTAMMIQMNPAIVSDGAGGAIAAWEDWNSGDQDIYTQRVNASGVVQWTADGVPLCAMPEPQSSPRLVSDGAGGAIVTWSDSRAVFSQDIYARRVTASGAVQWTDGGVALCTATGNQYYPMIVSDGASGAIVTWYDYRGGSSYDVYAQRVNASGSVLWTTDGVGLCAATGDQYSPMIASDGASGAIVTWVDYRSGSYDIYAQRVNASGTAQWAADGVPLCTATGEQGGLAIVSAGAGCALIAWYDGRSVDSYDVYAQLIDTYGRTGYLAPSINAVRDVPGDQGGNVYLSWLAALMDVFKDTEMSYYSIWRAINPTKASLAFEKGASSLDDLSKLDRSSGKGVIRVERASGRTFFWELVGTVDAFYKSAYGKTIATLFDSTSVCTEYHYFEVVAHTTTSTVFWESEPDSGYSVDNLTPCPPIGFAGEQSFTPAGLELTWDPNTETDLGHYAAYRGTSADFIPGAENLIASTCDTMLLDSGWRWDSDYYYKVSALDVHGNESGFALLTPDGVTGTDTPKAPEASYLAQNYPNPFNPTTRVAFGLSAPAHVSLRIYDAAGRLVRALVNDERRAGRYEETWDGRDSGSRSVASGIYFYRLNAGTFESTKKMILLR